MPDSFIPIFEKNAFIVEIDFFMLSSIFQSIQSRLNEGLTVLPIAVNLSRTTLTFPNFIARLKNLVARYPVPLKYVEIEITESALVNDYEKVLARFEEIRKLNFPMAMDDFGAGYSSLNTLRELQVDVLKIDRLFLQESDTSERGRKIIQNIIRMSKEIDIEVVCEGVETKNQHDFLQENGCDYIQGYFYAKPMPYDDYIERYLSPKDSS
jgi:EAL domain-containing protein (putative c-di-GMP-specific phosphodiesterase class I)